MERIVYDQMAELDERHWWYRARREVLAALIRRLAQPKAGAHILEIGCGTGHNLPMLSGFVLNEAFTWVLINHFHGPTWWPLIPAIFVTPLATYIFNRQWVFG